MAFALLVFMIGLLSSTALGQTVTTYSTLTTVTVPLTTSTTTLTFTVTATTGTTTASYTFSGTTYSTYTYTEYTGTTYTVITSVQSAPPTTYTITSTFTSPALTGEATYTYTFGGDTITTWVYGVSTISGGSSTSGSSSSTTQASSTTSGSSTSGSSSSTTQASSTTNETSGSTSSAPNNDLLTIGAGLGLLILLGGGYLLWRRRKGPTEGPPPPPPPPPPPTSGTTPPPSTPPPVVPVPQLVTKKPPCPDGWVPKEDQACWGYVTLVVFAKPTVVVDGAYQSSEEDIEEAIKGVEKFLNVASWAGLVQGAAGSVAEGPTELVSSLIEGRTVDPAADAAMGAIRKLVEARRKLNEAGDVKVIFPREFFHYQCIVIRECVDGEWVVTDKKFVFERVKRGTPPEVVLDLRVPATDLARESNLLGQARTWAYGQNVAAYKKINECRKTCEQIADYSTWQPPEGSK